MMTIWGKGKSAKLLARELGVKRNLKRPDVFIRYKRLDYPQRFTKEINTLEAVKLASHKYKSLKVIEEAGCLIPPCSTNLSDLTKDGFSGIILARKFYHSKGSDIAVLNYKNGHLQHKPECSLGYCTDEGDCPNYNCDNMLGFYHRDYYVQYLKARAEYRYHVAFGKIILCTKKKLAEGEEDDSIIKNHQNGKWLQVVCKETPRFSASCVKAVAALGLDFGAVDFINYKTEPVILEVNTAPGLQVQNRLDAYVKAFKENIRR